MDALFGFLESMYLLSQSFSRFVPLEYFASAPLLGYLFSSEGGDVFRYRPSEHYLALLIAEELCFVRLF